MPDEEETECGELEKPDGGVAEIKPEGLEMLSWIQNNLMTHLSAPNMPRKTERRRAVSNW